MQSRYFIFGKWGFIKAMKIKWLFQPVLHIVLHENVLHHLVQVNYVPQSPGMLKAQYLLCFFFLFLDYHI